MAGGAERQHVCMCKGGQEHMRYAACVVDGMVQNREGKHSKTMYGVEQEEGRMETCRAEKLQR